VNDVSAALTAAGTGCPGKGATWATEPVGAKLGQVKSQHLDPDPAGCLDVPADVRGIVPSLAASYLPFDAY